MKTATSVEQYSAYVDDIRGMVQISDEDFELFRKHKAFLLKYAEALITFTINTIEEHPPANLVFEEKRGSSVCLGNSLGKWLGEVVAGEDTPEFWRRHYLIGLQHIKRGITNRNMLCLATRIREFLLPVMLESLGTEEGMKLYLAFQRFLDTVVALTITLVDEGQRRCIHEATGFTDKLIERLSKSVFEVIEKELGGDDTKFGLTNMQENSTPLPVDE